MGDRIAAVAPSSGIGKVLRANLSFSPKSKNTMSTFHLRELQTQFCVCFGKTDSFYPLEDMQRVVLRIKTPKQIFQKKAL